MWAKEAYMLGRDVFDLLKEVARTHQKEATLRLLQIEQDLVLQQSDCLGGPTDDETRKKKLEYSKRNAAINRERLALFGIEPAHPSVYVEDVKDSPPEEKECSWCETPLVSKVKGEGDWHGYMCTCCMEAD